MLDQILWQEIVHTALREDLGPGDWTTDAIVPEDAAGHALIVAQAPGVIAGLPLAKAVFWHLDPAMIIQPEAAEGQHVSPGQVIAEVKGSVRAILKGERVALNFLQRLSGIATTVAGYVEAVRGLPVRIADTRKTTPGLRSMEKYAVRVGGGINHRMGLYDAILIKDNHLRVAGGVAAAVERVRALAPWTAKIEVEAENLDQVAEALRCGVEIIMLDNMSLEEMRQAVQLVNGRALVEASGGVTIETVREIAATGVDVISVGALTHHIKAMDISLDII